MSLWHAACHSSFPWSGPCSLPSPSSSVLPMHQDLVPQCLYTWCFLQTDPRSHFCRVTSMLSTMSSAPSASSLLYLSTVTEAYGQVWLLQRRIQCVLSSNKPS
jgi:hypothetical protein